MKTESMIIAAAAVAIGGYALSRRRAAPPASSDLSGDAARVAGTAAWYQNDSEKTKVTNDSISASWADIAQSGFDASPPFWSTK